MSKSMKSFLRGMGSCINIYPRPAPSHIRSPITKSDSEAIRGDWEHIGQDLRNASINIPFKK